MTLDELPDAALDRYHRDAEFHWRVETSVTAAESYAVTRAGRFTVEDRDVARLAASIALVVADTPIADLQTAPDRPPLPAAAAFTDPLLRGGIDL